MQLMPHMMVNNRMERNNLFSDAFYGVGLDDIGSLQPLSCH